MDKRKARTITISDDAWEQLGIFAESMSTSRSGAIELFAKYVNRGQTMPAGAFVGGVIQDVFEIFKSGRGPGKKIRS